MKSMKGGFWPIIAFNVLAIVFAVVVSFVAAAEKSEIAPKGPLGMFVEAVNVRVIDGDTIYCDIKLPFDIMLADQTVRAEHYDAWESSNRRRTVGEITDDEVAKGRAATEALRELFAGKRTYLGPSQPPPYPANQDGVVGGIDHTTYFGEDTYGRTMAELWAWDGKRWTDVREWMIANGHVRPRIRMLKRNELQIIIVEPPAAPDDD